MSIIEEYERNQQFEQQYISSVVDGMDDMHIICPLCHMWVPLNVQQHEVILYVVENLSLLASVSGCVDNKCVFMILILCARMEKISTPPDAKIQGAL